MIAEIISSIYVLLLFSSILATYKKMTSAAFNGFLSGAILLSYSIYLHYVNELQNKMFLVILALALIQLATIDIGRKRREINVLHQLIRLIFHIFIGWLLLK